MTTLTGDDRWQEILGRMREMVEAERLVHGVYVSTMLPHTGGRGKEPEYVKEGSLCGGAKACAVGALVLAAGFKTENRFTQTIDENLTGEEQLDTQDAQAEDEASWPNGRNGFMRRHPDVGRVYRALNEAAWDYAATNQITWPTADVPWQAMVREGPMEVLFESVRPTATEIDQAGDEHKAITLRMLAVIDLAAYSLNW